MRIREASAYDSSTDFPLLIYDHAVPVVQTLDL